ncbi:hypothetical protein HO345_04355 [Treponema denticola]|uniref:hypothetical protein n=1 Tax=Treponema denticola TaxID=158 RepID=UPI0020A30254|nr:hypothetical protein [Treponema denticola]UTD12265.1 hypothetical protein HO345_04355 [Treponema denticola]
MKKIILVVATFITVAGIAFAASCYKYHYVLSAHCTGCYQYQTIEVDRNDDHNAVLYAKSNFSKHSADCKHKGSTFHVEVSITSKSKNEYEECN